MSNYIRLINNIFNAEYYEREALIKRKEREEKEYRRRLRDEKREKDEAARVIMEAERLEFLRFGAEEIAAANRAASRPGTQGGTGEEEEHDELHGLFHDLIFDRFHHSEISIRT